MKKKILAAMFATVCLAGCAAGLAACGGGSDDDGKSGGGRDWTGGTVLVDGSGAEHDSSYTYDYDMGEYSYGTQPDLSTLKLYIKYTDGTRELADLTDGSVIIKYFYEHNLLASKPDVYDLGNYQVEYTYNGTAIYVTFEIVISATASPYQFSLDKNSWAFLEEPAVTLTKGGTAIDENTYEVRCITTAKYDEIKDAADFNEILEENSAYYSYGTKPGAYYLFAYTAGSKHSSNFVAVNIQKADVIPSGTDFSAVTAEYDYGYDGVIGDVNLSDIQINTSLLYVQWTNSRGSNVYMQAEWQSPDSKVNSSDNGTTKGIKFVPADYDSDYYNEYVVSDGIPLTIKKGGVDKVSQDEGDPIYYNGEEHVFEFNWGDLQYFKEKVTVKYNGSLITLGNEKVLGRETEVGVYTYTFELKDPTNYYWVDDDNDNNQTDVANKTLTYEIKKTQAYVNLTLSNGGNSFTPDENSQVKIKLEPGVTDGSHNITPYKAGTLTVQVLEQATEPDSGSTMSSTVQAQATIETEGGFDYVVITVDVSAMQGNSGQLLIKLTADGDGNYADIDYTEFSLIISKI